MNTSNEWLEITTISDISEIDISGILSPLTLKFLYPINEELFTIRLLGKLCPYYRSYINPKDQLYNKITTSELKKCLSGDANTILSVAKRIIENSQYLKEFYKVELDKNKIIHTFDFNRKTTELERIEENGINFLERCIENKSMWSPCIISNAYIRNGTRLLNSLQPIVITRTMFTFFLDNAVSDGFISKDSKNFNISGICAYDLYFYKNLQDTSSSSKLFLKIVNAPNVLTYSDIAFITKHKLINIESFVKSHNKQSVDAYNGFIYKPHKSLRDVSETLKIVKEFSKTEKDEEYESAEKELCNISPELTNYTFESGPIESVEIE